MNGGPIGQWLRSRFIAGFFVTVPLVISIAALVWIFGIIDDFTAPLATRLVGRAAPGVGILMMVLFVLLIGAVATNVIGRRILGRAEQVLTRVPVFKTIYSPVRQLVAAFSPDNEYGFKRVVMVEDERRGLVMGFLTKEFTVVSLHPGVSREQVQETCGWKVKFAEALDETPAPTELELKTLRDLQARTKAAHRGTAKGKAA